MSIIRFISNLFGIFFAEIFSAFINIMEPLCDIIFAPFFSLLRGYYAEFATQSYFTKFLAIIISSFTITFTILSCEALFNKLGLHLLKPSVLLQSFANTIVKLVWSFVSAYKTIKEWCCAIVRFLHLHIILDFTNEILAAAKPIHISTKNICSSIYVGVIGGITNGNLDKLRKYLTPSMSSGKAYIFTVGFVCTGIIFYFSFSN